MEKDLRASVLAASASAALSALIGVIAGVGILTLLLRALAFGLVVGAGAYGCITLLRSMVPEVLTPLADQDEAELPAAEAAPAPQEPLAGANLDIVLPGDEASLDILAPGADAFEPAALGEGAISSAQEARPEARGRAEPRPEARAAVRASAGIPSPVEELEEASLLEPESGSGSAAEPAIPANADFDKDRRSSVGFDELDMLPDLDGFTDSFTASEFASGGSSGNRAEAERPMPSSGASSQARSGAAAGMDPAEMAKAVRTILKRDQKG